MMKKGQSAIEFLIIIGAAVFMFVLFLIAVQINLNDETNNNRNFIAREIASIVQDEIKLAHESVNGYRREFKIPLKITNLNYDIDIVDNSFVYVRTTNGKYALSLPVSEVVGNVQKGDNIIRKEEGSVYLN